MTGGLVSLRRTSPSGGGMHPVDAYVAARHVDGLASGYHHYDVESHRLGLLRAVDADAVREEVTGFLVGQEYFGDANVVFFLVARFDRLHWKYPDHERAFLVAVLDAGHLSQTFQLTCTDLGLGSFVTAAVNTADVDLELGLDGCAAATLAVVGCGHRSAFRTPLHPDLRDRGRT